MSESRLTLDGRPGEAFDRRRVRQREAGRLRRVRSEGGHGPDADLVTLVRKSDHPVLVGRQEDAPKGGLRRETNPESVF
jgi:hypothetical protein